MIILSFLILNYFIISINCNCATIFAKPGVVDITNTLRNCSEHMVDPLLPSSYSNDQYNFTVYSQVVLNNLLEIDEIVGTVQLDFIYRVSWIDPRWVIPDMWNYLKPQIAREGITITDIVKGSDPLDVWLSDNVFYDEITAEIVAEAIRFKPGGSMYWTRHFVMTISQPFFDYKKYPIDTQEIVIRISPYTYSTAFVRMEWTNPPVLYVRAKPDSTPNFMLNQIWSHKLNDYKTEVYVVDVPTNANGILIPRQFEFSFLNVTIARKEKGIVIRLIAPIVALMILGGVTFWAILQNRLASTMTILLSISALYIAVFGQIPLVGYLTSFDRYVITMYCLLIICAFLHQITIRLHGKIIPWPFRIFCSRLIEACGRLFVAPLSLSLFLVYFSDSKMIKDNIPMFISILVLYFSLFSLREFGGLRKSFDQSMQDLYSKVQFGIKDDKNETVSYKLSYLERILYYFYYSQWLSGDEILTRSSEIYRQSEIRRSKQNSKSIELTSKELIPVNNETSILSTVLSPPISSSLPSSSSSLKDDNGNRC